MDPISKFLTEQNNFKKLYHISEENLDNKTLIPRVPDNYMTKNGYEDAKIKRVSFCTSIQGCLMALSANISGKVFYVHEPIDYNVRILFNKDIITKKYVPDAHITGETWVLETIKLKNVMTILVKSAKSKSYEYKLEDKTKKRLYEWNYDVISEFDVINIDKNKYKDNVSKKDYMGKEIIRYNDEKKRKNPETIAYILLSENEYGHLEVDALYVLNKKYQGRGFGRALMKMYENKAQVLYTEQENHKARGFYEKIGWKNSGITSNFSKEKPNKKWCLYYNSKTIEKGELEVYKKQTSCYVIKKSKIAGKGCFSTCVFRENDRIGLAFTKIGNTGDPDKDYDRTEFGALVNHSTRPNLFLDKTKNQYFYSAKKDIKVGEEFTIDYNAFPWEGERDFANND